MVEIAKKLGVSDGTVRSWKKRYDWDSTSKNKNCNVAKISNKKNATLRKKGGQNQNQNALKHGLFAKYLPPETLDIIQSTQKADPLDLLWDNIQIQYAAIIRAQQIMYVSDKEDMTKDIKSETENGSVYEIQFAWDKQANFLSAQSRAMSTLQNMIKNYDELIHKNWEIATEEQKARIEVLKSKVNSNDSEDDSIITEMLEGLKE